MNQKLAPLQLQKNTLAAVMQKSIGILLLPVTELSAAIEQELQNNPLLEIDETQDSTSEPEKYNESNLSKTDLAKLFDETSPYDSDIDTDLEEISSRPISRSTTLEDHLMQQIRLETLDPLRLKIAEEIIGNIDEDGYLTITCDEIAHSLNLNDTTCIEEVLNIIQSLEPLGIASRNLKECLLIQLKNQSHLQNPKIFEIIENHLEDLGRKRYRAVAQKTGLTIDEVKTVARMIALLEPKPARNFRPVDPSIYIQPDIIFRRDESDYLIEINTSNIPTLKVNTLYRKLLNQPHLPEPERKFIEEKLQSALYFIKCIKQREETLMKIAQVILESQINFFESGLPVFLPLTLKDVAEAIDRDESTVSRAIRNKYVDTPHGIYPMKFFFSGAISTTTNGHIASRGVKEEIKDMIDEEDKTFPLSDQDIQNRFLEKGIKIARRTIAKYRQLLQIPPSNLRKV